MPVEEVRRMSKAALRIYDTPRELSEFTGLRNTRFGAAPYDIKHPPQSWCYVEVMKDE